jgi:hypothetical protein
MSNRIPAVLTRIAALTTLLAVTGCASGPRVIANSAPDFSISDYRTFSYLQPLSSDRGNVRSLISTHLINATTPELENAGLRYVENGGDLLVNFVVSTRETIQTRSTPSTSVSMHHGRGRYGTWGGYSMSMSTTEVVQRTEGTIAVDIISRARNQLVWEGAAVGRVTDSTRQNIQQVVNETMPIIFEQFP